MAKANCASAQGGPALVSLKPAGSKMSLFPTERWLAVSHQNPPEVGTSNFTLLDSDAPVTYQTASPVHT